ncbi:retrovirus-related pol polyprotein from transposon TNT 1-94, partial [Tanacetum coccineum]
MLTLLLRRSTRDHHPSTRYSAHEYVLLTDGGKPECYAKAIEDEHKKEWFEAMEDEMNSLHENNTFELVKLPKGKRALKNKWVYKLKTEEHTYRPRYKARLVVKCFSQKRGIDFDEIFSPVVKMGSIRVVLRWIKWMSRQLFFMKFGDDDFIILLLYVDDMLIVGKNVERIAQLKLDLSKSFAMKDLGPAKQIIGIRIFRNRGAKKFHISQEQYIEKVLCRLSMDKDKVVSSPLTTNFKLTDKDCPSSKKNIEKMDIVPYASAVGSLMYSMVCTRQYLAHVVGVVSRFLSNPDSDMAENKDNMKSTSGYLMTFVGGAKREEGHRVLLHSQMSWSQKGRGEVKAEAQVTKGHTMKFYKQLKKENKKKNYNNQKNKHKKDDGGDDNTEVNTTTDEFFVCYDYDMVNLANDNSSWILDSGAMCHFDTGMELVLHNVKHVPDMRLNIISTGLLDEDGYHNSSSNGLWKVTLGSLIVTRGKRESKLYMNHPKISKSIVNAVDNDDMTELWHKRLGVHDINLKKCSHCLAGKQTRLAFKSRYPFRMENILDL